MLPQPSSVCEYTGLNGPVMELFIAGTLHPGIKSCLRELALHISSKSCSSESPQCIHQSIQSCDQVLVLMYFRVSRLCTLSPASSLLP